MGRSAGTPVRARGSKPGTRVESVSADERTIRDFGDQWSQYGDNEGLYGSAELLRDILGPLVGFDALRGARVADIGSGTGRIVRMLLEAGVERVLAIEPSVGVERLRENTAEFGERVEILHARGDAIPPGLELDFVISIGVIQFIRDPLPTLRAAREALRPGGRIVIWVYGREGNGAYLALLAALRVVTTRLSHAALAGLCHVLVGALDLYTLACRALPLPLRDYLVNTLSRVSRRERMLTVYDQLNPSYVEFYRRDEVERLLESAGFENVQLHHRRGYSWTALGVKPSGSGDGAGGVVA